MAGAARFPECQIAANGFLIKNPPVDNLQED
jgi:hypothetical protein